MLMMNVFLLLKNIRKVVTNVSCKFQEIWVVKMPLVEPIFYKVGLVFTMKCYVCTIIEREKKNWLLNGILLKNISVKEWVLMVSGPWIQNVCMLKMRLFTFSFL